MKQGNFNAKRHVLVLAAIILFGFVADQASKQWMERRLHRSRSTVVVPNFINLTLVHNKGAAFGIGAGWAKEWRFFFFILMSLAAVAFLIYYAYRLRHAGWLPNVALAMILSGACGNLLDRIKLGYVIDFIDVYVKSYHWPAFNIADSMICVGVGLFCYYLLTEEGKSESP